MDDLELQVDRLLGAGRTITGESLTPGVNVDPVDVEAGVEFARHLGYSGVDLMVIQYALLRWRRGEETGAEKTITSYRVDFTCWRMILAKAVTSLT